jgi:hypothetical protein
MTATYTIAADGRSITCHRCGRTSHNANDVAQLYCSPCNRFHDDDTLAIWTVYDHPTDFPDSYVARRFLLERPTRTVMIEPTLDALRSKLAALGLVRLARSPEDDPKIVEVWL